MLMIHFKNYDEEKKGQVASVIRKLKEYDPHITINENSMFISVHSTSLNTWVSVEDYVEKTQRYEVNIGLENGGYLFSFQLDLCDTVF